MLQLNDKPLIGADSARDTLRLSLRDLWRGVWDRPHLRLLAANTGWLMLDKFVRLALAITVGAWTARYLGPARYGELSYCVALVALFQTVANLGADGIVIRDLVTRPKHVGTILGTVFRLRLSFGAAAWVAAIASVLILRPHDLSAVLMTAIVGGSLVFQAADTIDLWFQSQNQNKRTVAPKLSAYILTNGVKVLLVAFGAPLVMFAGALALDAVAAACGLWISYRQYPASGQVAFRLRQAESTLRESYPFLLSGLAIMVYMRIDQVMIREMIGEAELGAYSAAVGLSNLWAFVPLTLSTVLGPYVARQKALSSARYQETLEIVFAFFSAVSILVVLGVLLFGRGSCTCSCSVPPSWPPTKCSRSISSTSSSCPSAWRRRSGS